MVVLSWDPCQQPEVETEKPPPSVRSSEGSEGLAPLGIFRTRPKWPKTAAVKDGQGSSTAMMCSECMPVFQVISFEAVTQQCKPLDKAPATWKQVQGLSPPVDQGPGNPAMVNMQSKALVMVILPGCNGKGQMILNPKDLNYSHSAQEALISSLPTSAARWRGSLSCKIALRRCSRIWMRRPVSEVRDVMAMAGPGGSETSEVPCSFGVNVKALRFGNCRILKSNQGPSRRHGFMVPGRSSRFSRGYAAGCIVCKCRLFNSRLCCDPGPGHVFC